MQHRKGRGAPWVVQWREFRGADKGKVKTAYFSKKDDAQKLKEKIRRQRQAWRHGLELPDEDLLLIDYSKSWMKRRVRDPELSRSSVMQDESRLRNYWLPELGSQPIAFIASADILRVLDWIQFERGHAAADRNRHRALMHKLFHDAFMEGRVQANPVARIPLIKETPRRKIVRVKEQAHVDAYLAGLRAEGRQYWTLGCILELTGCRISEAIALQFQDVDFDRGIVLIRRIESRAGGSRIVERTKGTGLVEEESAAHVIPLFPALASLVSLLRDGRRPTDFIASQPGGGYVPYDTFKDVHHRVIERLTKADPRYPRFTPHSIRRYFATSAKKAGMTRAEIRELGGWSSEAVVARYDAKDVEHLAERAKVLGFGLRLQTEIGLTEGPKSAVSDTVGQNRKVN
jgi:integrase